MTWVHCNSCYIEPHDPRVKGDFFLTSCSHISCQKCYESFGIVCPTCKKDGIRFLRIDSSMLKQYRQYFTDVPKIITSKMEEMEKIKRFQDIQIQNLVKGTFKFQDMVKKAQDAMKKYEEEQKRLKKENQDLSNALKKVSFVPPRSKSPHTAQNDEPRSRSVPRFDGNNIPRPVLREPHSAPQQQRTRSRSPLTAHIDEPRSRSRSVPRCEGKNVPQPELREPYSAPQQQRTRSKSPLTAVFMPDLNRASSVPPRSNNAHTDEPRSRSRSIPRYEGKNIPQPELRATYSAQPQPQRSRSKSPSNAVFMQGTIGKGSILSIGRR